MPKDPYIVLGLPSDATFRDIKRAYRTIVKRYHPDSGQSDADTEKLTEARAAYDRLTDRFERGKRPSDRRPLWRRSTGRPSGSGLRNPFSRYTGPSGPFSSHRDEPNGPIAHGCPVTEAAEASGSADLSLEVWLTSEEGLAGGRFPVQVACRVPCPACGSRLPRSEARHCPLCRGRRAVVRPLDLLLVLPPGTIDGTTAVLSLRDAGMPSLRLHLFVHVSPAG